MSHYNSINSTLEKGGRPRILLIDPPFKIFTGFVNFYFPMGLGTLAAVLRQAGCEVKIFEVDALKKGSDIDFSEEYKRLELYRQSLNDDNHWVWQEIKKVLDDYRPDLVGITAMTTKFGSVLKTAEIVKKWGPKYPVIVGGPHATILPEQVLKSENIDIVVRGEGEETILELIQALKVKRTLYGIKGISFKDNNAIIHNPDRQWILNLDEIPFPARDLLMNPQNYTSEDMGAVMCSRGCPFNCTYCCHPWGRRVRYRSIENVISEVKEVKDKYGTEQFEFKDDTFTVNRGWIIQFCDQLISQKININWGCTTRANLIDDELIKKMKKAGCNNIKLGIETGSERILKETKKGVSFEEMKKAAKILNKNKVFWSGYFMMGLPTETEEDILKTYQFMKELNPYYAGLGVYNPFPATELFEQGVKLGLLRQEVELDHFFKTNPKDYFFIDPNRRTLNIPKEKFDELTKFMMEKFHQHNTQLRNIIRRAWARKRAYIGDFKLLFKDFRRVINWIFKI
jgi:radical SAM superfamily enzyme YgiQ (UPF0313 family)